MHGLIANQLRSYAVARHGREAWRAALAASGGALPEAPALDQIYPDQAIVGVVVALAERTGNSVPAFLEDFGAFLAPTLLRVYEPLVRPEWRTLDVIEHVEERIHTAVRLRDPSAGPPYLTARRVSPTEVEVVYTSPRRLCFLAEGIARGMAGHFREAIAVLQTECMHRGDARCLISVRLQS